MAQRDLKKVQTAAGNLEKARAGLRDAIYRAHLSGESHRDIAPYAGLSPTRTYQLLQEAKQLAQPEEP